MRLAREIDYSEDFRKKYLSRDYGNYDKYEKNAIKTDLAKGEDDKGYDQLQANFNQFVERTST